MSPKTLEQRLAELDARHNALKNRLTKQERANDTRRKILLGAFLIHSLETGKPQIKDTLHQWLHSNLEPFLTRDIDKQLLNDFIAKKTESPSDQSGSYS